MSIQKQQLQGSFVKASECFVKPTMDLVLTVSKSQRLHETSKGLYTYPSSPLIDYEAITPCSWPQFPHLKIRKLTYWVISKVLSIPDLLWPWDIRCLFSAAIWSNVAMEQRIWAVRPSRDLNPAQVLPVINTEENTHPLCSQFPHL